MDEAIANLFRTALNAYLSRLEAGGLDPVLNYLPYDFDHNGGLRWNYLGREMVENELQELTNILNHWHNSLLRWHAWNCVLASYETQDAWLVRWEFLEPIVHQCLLLPSSVRDVFTFVATNSLHQVRLASEPEYKDYLQGDPKTPEDRPRHLTRHQKESRLSDLSSCWAESVRFIASLRDIDDEEYRSNTSDYRNRNSHSIGPRLGIGITRTVTREVVQATQIIPQADGTGILTPIPGKLSVSYGFGGPSLSIWGKPVLRTLRNMSVRVTATLTTDHCWQPP